jgi:acetylornithine deacetylase
LSRAYWRLLFVYFYPLKLSTPNDGRQREKSSGANGLASMLSIIPHIDVAIVGESTDNQAALGAVWWHLMQLSGTAGHAAHPNDNNAIGTPVLQLFMITDLRRVRPVT